MTEQPDICGDVLHSPPGQSDICRRPTGHHGAHVARPWSRDSTWWTSTSEPMISDHPQPMIIYHDPDQLGFH